MTNPDHMTWPAPEFEVQLDATPRADLNFHGPEIPDAVALGLITRRD